MSARRNIVLFAALLPLPAVVITASGQACPASVTDIDGNTYPAVLIGDQCWMSENLKTAHYRDGSVIPNTTNLFSWALLNSGAWCNYDNDPVSDTIYGKLYNGHAVGDVRGLCPQGWHVPSDAEWQQLELTLGMPTGEVNTIGLRGVGQHVGWKLKATTHWPNPNLATNESGFTALPGGNRGSGGSFYDIGYYGSWWSSSDTAWYRALWSSSAGVDRNYYGKRAGFSVRCLKDNVVGFSEQKSPQFSLSPNPTAGIFTLQMQGPSIAQLVTLHDSTGRAVLTQRIHSSGPVTLDLSGHENGLYFVNVLYKDGSSATGQVVKQ
ncbi:MAG: T9SS type A sorting domain-containing protein [Flavobacteriales bacterium]|nr:T9SS type A sorting domain-containing protein [Flavobacteriales bacterium]